MASSGIVLVHGGFHSAACWSEVLAHLEGPAIAVDLPGRGACPANLATVTLQDCVAAVFDAAAAAGFNDFTLVGHSIGGVTITEAAQQNPVRVRHLVYVAGLIPSAEQSVAAMMSGADFPPGEMPMIEEPIARELFGNDLDDEQWAAFWRTCVPETSAGLNARVSGYPRGVPTTYVSMTDDVAVPPGLAARMIEILGPHVHHRILGGGHSAFISRPVELTAVIIAAAQVTQR